MTDNLTATPTLIIVYIIGFFATNILTYFTCKGMPLDKHPGCIPGLTWPLLIVWLLIRLPSNKIKTGKWFGGSKARDDG